MSRPLISIVMCCHNRQHLLEETLASIYAQNYDPVEIIVLDDGSTDGTKELMASQGDKIQYAWQESQGSAAARNAACKMAKGDYIAFHDDDDIMHADRITRLYEALCKYPNAIFATGDYEIIDEKGKKTGRRWRPKNNKESSSPQLIVDSYAQIMWARIPANPCNTLFKRQDGERIGWLDTDFRYAASDKDFFGRLALLGSIVYVPEIMYYLRRGHSSIWSSDVRLRAESGSLQLYEKHLELTNSIVIKKRFQRKRLQTLCNIATGKSHGLKIDSPTTEHIIKHAITSLPLPEFLYYQYYTHLKLPTKKLFKKNI